VFAVPSVLAMLVGAALCVAFVERRTVELPDQESVFEASILSGGGEA